MLLWVMRLRRLAQCQRIEMSPGLLQDFMDGYIRLSPLAIEHGVVVMTEGFQSIRSQIESRGESIFDSRFIKFVFKICGGKYF